MNTATTLVTEVNDYFHASYSSARSGILKAIHDTSCRKTLLSLPLDAGLSTEAAWLGSPEAQQVLVLISGTHGVEGAVGTAIQQDVLARLGQALMLPKNTALLIIFSLNPQGFAANRRCDGERIDLNRNFIDFSRPLPDNPGYRELMKYLSLPAADRQRHFDAFRKQHGQASFEIAISGGQYCDPQGPFYGGQAPGHGNRVIERIIEHYALSGRNLAVVDIHSGLGPYGHGEIICDHPPGTSGFHAAKQWYGPATTAPAEGTSSSAIKEGLLDYRWHVLMQERGCFVTLEFGTYSLQALFDTVLNDHRAWATGDPAAIRQSAVAMRNHFCPPDGFWRELILLKGRQVTLQALKGLQT